MSENKYCGNCKHFKDEDIEGFSYCEIEHGLSVAMKSALNMKQ